MEQHPFREPHFAYISVTFLFTSNTHFQVRHTHFYGTFAFSDLFLTNQVRRIRLSEAPSLYITPLRHLLTTARLAQSVECWTYVDQEVLSLNPSQAKSLKILGAIMLSLGNLVQFIGSHLWWESTQSSLVRDFPWARYWSLLLLYGGNFCTYSSSL